MILRGKEAEAFLRKIGMLEGKESKYRNERVILDGIRFDSKRLGRYVFEDEFMSNIVLPGGQTVGEFMKPQISEAYRLGSPPKMLPMLGGNI